MSIEIASLRSFRTACRTALLAGLLLSGCSSSAPADDLPRAPGHGSVSVTVTGFEHSGGQALIALFLTAEGFPGDIELAHSAQERPIEEGRAEVVFEDVPAGPYAVTVFHDEDLDFELDTGFMGIPSEKWGVSRDAGGFFGPPTFKQARLELTDGDEQVIEVPIG